MFCMKCGTQIPDGAKFCLKCGTPVPEAAAPAPQPAAPEPAPTPAAEIPNPIPAVTPATPVVPVPMVPPVTPAVPLPAVAPVTPAPKAPKKKSKAPVIGAVAACTVLAVGGVAAWKYDDITYRLDMNKAEKLYKEKEYEDATEFYLKAMSKTEDQDDAVKGLMKIASALEKEEDYKGALEIYDAILDENKKNKKANEAKISCVYNLARQTAEKGDYDKAESYIKEYQELCQKNGLDYSTDAFNFMTQKDYAVTPSVTDPMVPNEQATEHPADRPADYEVGTDVREDAPVAMLPETEIVTTLPESPYGPLLLDENGNVYDLGGMEVTIRDWWSGEPSEPQNAYEEARQEYLDWAQYTYNFIIRETAISDWGSTPFDYINYVTSGGDDSNYIFTLREDSELISSMYKGLMYDVNSLGVFDFSEAKWGSNAHKKYSVGDAVYGFRAIPSEPRIGMYFNKRLLSQAGYSADYLYSLQERGEWTWETFEEICNGIQQYYGNSVYGMVAFNSDWYCASVASNDADFIGKTADGRYEYRLESRETMQALNWAQDMMDHYTYPQPEESNWDYWIEAFQNGKGAFFAGAVYQADMYWSADKMFDEVGFLCFPKGPNAYDYINSSSDNFYAIPGCYDPQKAKYIAIAYDLYTREIPGYEGYNPYLNQYRAYFSDTESVDYTLNRMTKTNRVTYYDMIPDIQMGPDLLWNINSYNRPAQVAETIRDKWMNYVDEANRLIK